ncbi:FxsA family protein [Halovulum dunhuangense]|uniref:FxsA family protein n=1 Tax=Halovulum dunhuangense TaxID=1505036 RepID=A0A849KU49_9RHOB|nr:FxsA family protein [Halovulum dunhuangense]NNU79101.1 FxsA family protein [Halovulum dunhuangense]
MWLFVLFVLVPIIEIALFIQVGGFIGLWPTLAIVIATAAAGTFLVRGQGLATLAQLQASMDRGGDPTGPLANGVLILVAGLLLLTPGFFTDGCGFALLVPQLRAALIRWGAARLASRIHVAGAHHSHGTTRYETRADIIEGEYRPLDDDGDDRSKGSSGWTKPH